MESEKSLKRSGCMKLALKTRWEFFFFFFFEANPGGEKETFWNAEGAPNRSRSRKNLASLGNGQEFDRREIANLFLRTVPLPSVDFDTLGD